MSDSSSNGARKRKHNEIKPKMQSTLDNFTFARVTEDAHQHETEFATPTSPTLFNFEKSKSINNLLDSNVSQPKKMVIKGFKGTFPSRNGTHTGNSETENTRNVRTRYLGETRTCSLCHTHSNTLTQ
jgi:hypothetical protein